jgi:lycopene cyclase domain-containing protein
MFGAATYLIWLASFIGVPLLVLIALNPAALGQQKRALGLAVLGALVGGWLWDAAAVRVGLWYYDPDHIFGVWILGLPLEEWLWIMGVTLLFGGVTALLKAREAQAWRDASEAAVERAGDLER